jgi:hypothetical protein
MELHLPWNNHSLLGSVSLLQQRVEIPHDALKGRTHEIERSIRENDGILFELSKVFFRDDFIVQRGALLLLLSGLGCTASAEGSSSGPTDQRFGGSGTHQHHGLMD